MIVVLIVLGALLVLARGRTGDPGVSTGTAGIRMATPGASAGTAVVVLPLDAMVEIVLPVAYVLLRRTGRAPDVGSVGVIGTRTSEARAVGGWAVWRYGVSTEGTVWRRAIAKAREKINEEWSPDADAVIGGVVAAIAVLVTSAVGIVTGGTAAVAALVGYAGYIARTATTAVAQKEAMASAGQRFAGDLAADIRRIAYEWIVFERLFRRRGFPQPALVELRTIGRDAIEFSAPREWPSLGTPAEVADWREDLLNVADERRRVMESLSESQIAASG